MTGTDAIKCNSLDFSPRAQTPHVFEENLRSEDENPSTWALSASAWRRTNARCRPGGFPAATGDFLRRREPHAFSQGFGKRNLLSFQRVCRGSASCIAPLRHYSPAHRWPHLAPTAGTGFSLLCSARYAKRFYFSFRRLPVFSRRPFWSCSHATGIRPTAIRRIDRGKRRDCAVLSNPGSRTATHSCDFTLPGFRRQCPR